MDEKKVFASVLIPTYNRREMLEGCLDSLSKQTYPFDKFEVVVVNDGSTDDTEAFLKEYQKTSPFQLNFISQKNADIAGARNSGIKICRGEVVCFTDDDCIADKDWLKNLLPEYDDKTVGCVGGEIVAYPPKTLAEKYAEEKRFVAQRFMVCGPVVTANTSYRKDILLEVNGFDEYCPPTEDGELGIRVKLRGHKFVYAKNAVILHKHRSTLKGLLIQQYKYGAGYQRMHKKYLKNFTPDYTLIMSPIKIIYSIVTYPITIVKSRSAKDKEYYLARPLLDIAVYSVHIYGMLEEMFFGKPYPKEKFTEEIPFLPEKTIGSLIRKVTSKIT